MNQHSPTTDTVAAENADAALQQMESTKEFFTDLATAFRQGTHSQYGWRGKDFAEGIAARIDTVVAWIEHVEVQQQAEVIDYRRHALGLVG